MSDPLASHRAQNAKKQAKWRAMHPEHKEAHRVYMQRWRSKRKKLRVPPEIDYIPSEREHD